VVVTAVRARATTARERENILTTRLMGSREKVRT
jgi:hypothetical protein